jgi:tetratricopeptide (TPR) repeat protein
MTTQEIRTIYGQTVKSLDKRELKAAFDSLQTLVSHTHAFQDELYGLQETYKRLLYYYTEGSRDPMQAKIYSELTASAYELADKTVQSALTRDSSHLYYSARRTFEMHPEDIATLAGNIRSAHEVSNIAVAEASTAQLFRRIWTSGYLTEEDVTGLHSAIVAAGGLTVMKCQIVSSLILGLQAFFDRRKFLLLALAAESDDREVQIRAYTGILLTLYLYRFRVDCIPEIRHRLDALAERVEFRKIVYMIILRFILSRDTEKISNKIREEIIPEMMKLKSKFNPHSSFGDMFPENQEGEMNPEWIEKLSDGKLGKNIEEFNRLQEEGADVMHSTFVHLKNFPFFNEISNWFRPFLIGDSSISEEEIIMKSLEVIVNIGFMCNSDLYSFYFSTKQIPEAGRKMMMSRLESQLGEVLRERVAEIQTRYDAAERIVGQYVQDLYRFYKLYVRHHEFDDIFTQPLDFHNLPVLQAYFSDRNDLMNIADHYLQKNYFDDALYLYGRLSESSEEEALYQKTGYCRQMTGDYERALADYAKAEIINPGSKWLLRRTAQCFRAAKRPEKAIDYYLQYEKLDPENIAILLSIGSCYLDLKNYSEALKYYFKVDYLDAKGHKAWRPVAWCSFLTGKYDQARNYYGRILSRNPDAQDYMNAGHTEWVLQNVKGALDRYKKSVEALNGDYEKFRTEFNRDMPELAAAGIDPAEIPLILDQLHYSLE